MKTIKKIIILLRALFATCLVYSQPPGGFDNPKVDFYWIAFDYTGARQFGDTLEGMNGGWPVDDPVKTGQWSAYVDDITFLPWFNTWFYNGPLDSRPYEESAGWDFGLLNCSGCAFINRLGG